MLNMLNCAEQCKWKKPPKKRKQKQNPHKRIMNIWCKNKTYLLTAMLESLMHNIILRKAHTSQLYIRFMNTDTYKFTQEVVGGLSEVVGGLDRALDCSIIF